MRNVAFDVAAQYAVGVRTAVALNADGIVVAVEQLGTRSLMQRLGRIDVGAIAFGTPVQYGSGLHPSIAVGGEVVVEVHQTNDLNLAYHIGSIEKNALNLGAPVLYDEGSDPAVAINRNGTVVGVQNDNGGTNFFIRAGRTMRTNTGALSLDHWGSADKTMLTSRAVNGAIAINSAGLVVVAFRRPGQLLAIMAGQVAGFEITWGPEFQYGRGTLPALALTDDNIVVEAHLEQQFDRTFLTVTNVGPLDPVAKTVSFPVDTNIFAPVAAFERRANTITTLSANTNNVAVAANRTLAVETFSDANNAAGYSASLIIDRANWMGDNLPALGGKVLRELSIPGSHDAFTYNVGPCSLLGTPCAAKTQDATFFDQLQSGVRYFDIRPAIFQNELYTGHFGDIGAAAVAALRATPSVVTSLIATFLGPLGVIFSIPAAIAATIAGNSVDRVQGCRGPRLADLLADVARFMQSGAREVVILKFSHYLDMDNASDVHGGVFEFDEAQTTRLVSAVVAALGNYLYTGPFPSADFIEPRRGRLSNTPLSTLLGNRGIVVPVFDLKGSVFKPQPGTYSYSDFQPFPMPPPLIIVPPTERPLHEPIRDPILETERIQFLQSNLLVYDKFASTPDLATLSADQLAKLRAVDNHSGDLFLLSWTLTLTDSQSFTCNDTSGTLTAATTADNALAAAITTEYASGGITQSTLPNILFVDRASAFATDVSVWLDQRMSLGDTLLGERRDYLGPGDSLVSQNGVSQLTYLPNGDLIVGLKGSTSRRSVSNTAGQPAWRCIMQEDGNFVIYSSPYVPIFASDTSGHGGARLVLLNSGRLGIFEPSGVQIPAPRLG